MGKPVKVFYILLTVRHMTCTRHGHQHRVTVTRGCIDTVSLSWWWAQGVRNM